jgi:hypothetical protein
MFFALGTPDAKAVAKLELYDGSNTVVVADQGVGDTNPLLGVIGYGNPLGSWIVNVTTGISKPVLGSATKPELDLSSVNVSSKSGGSVNLRIRFSDVDFGNLIGLTSFTSAIGGVTNGGVTFDTYYSNSNGWFDQANLLTSLSSNGQFAFSDTGYAGANPDSPYSLTLVANISHAGGVKTTSFNAAVSVPEPGTLILLGSGILGLAIAGRKTFRK